MEKRVSAELTKWIKNRMTKEDISKYVMSYIYSITNDWVWKLAYTLMFKYISHMQKLLNIHQKNMHTNFKILLISKILERYFTEMFY